MQISVNYKIEDEINDLLIVIKEFLLDLKMNMNDKNPFIYNIIQNLCSDEEIQQKGGIEAKDFISLLNQELEDISEKQGLVTQQGKDMVKLLIRMEKLKKVYILMMF